MPISRLRKLTLEDQAAQLGLSVDELVEMHLNELAAATEPAALNLPEERFEPDDPRGQIDPKRPGKR